MTREREKIKKRKNVFTDDRLTERLGSKRAEFLISSVENLFFGIVSKEAHDPLDERLRIAIATSVAGFVELLLDDEFFENVELEERLDLMTDVFSKTPVAAFMLKNSAKVSFLETRLQELSDRISRESEQGMIIVKESLAVSVQMDGVKREMLRLSEENETLRRVIAERILMQLEQNQEPVLNEFMEGYFSDFGNIIQSGDRELTVLVRHFRKALNVGENFCVFAARPLIKDLEISDLLLQISKAREMINYFVRKILEKAFVDFAHFPRFFLAEKDLFVFLFHDSDWARLMLRFRMFNDFMKEESLKVSGKIFEGLSKKFSTGNIQTSQIFAQRFFVARAVQFVSPELIKKAWPKKISGYYSDDLVFTSLMYLLENGLIKSGGFRDLVVNSMCVEPFLERKDRVFQDSTYRLFQGVDELLPFLVRELGLLGVLDFDEVKDDIEEELEEDALWEIDIVVDDMVSDEEKF